MRYLWALALSLASVIFAVSSCSGINPSSGFTGGAGGTSGASTGGNGTSTTTSTGTGGDFMFNDGGMNDSGCTAAVTCADTGANCGPIGDGCGGILDCGTCNAPGETCGGGGTPSVCGKPACVKKTCADAGANCGPVGDGCGGLLQCGNCPAGETCGGGGTPSVCGTQTTCTPNTCNQLGVFCGPAGDGCGGQLDCGNCGVGETCGGGGMPGVCGTPTCTPKTCADLNANCGPVADGCGALIPSCGTCTAPQICGGAGMPSVCGTPTSCVNLCLKQVVCSNPNVTTTISGTVYAPNGVDPLLNALVYVPNAPVLPFTQNISCDNCGAQASGSPLVSAVTGVDGKFQIKNAPVGQNIPLVIQLGRWRKQVTLPNVLACQNNNVAASLTRLPRNKIEGDIPRMAFVTGSLDALECLMLKIGVDASEFTNGSGNGRVHIYTGSTSAGASISGAMTEVALTSDLNMMKKYDMLLFPCQGSPGSKSSTQLANMLSYADAGGRVFGTHYGYSWFHSNGAFATTAQWNVDRYGQSTNTGNINMTFPKGQALAQWLFNPGASTTLGQIPLQELRADSDGVVSPTQLWISVNDSSYGTIPAHFTFNTPVGAQPANQCGRVVYDDFHVFGSSSGIFPAECSSGPMTPQEKLLEFMLFDLASCVTPDIPTCSPKTCQQLGANCGPAGDGCGNAIDCGVCPAGQTCGGGGISSVCGTPQCAAKSCGQLGIQCGPAGDGCGGLIQCGNCPAGQTCGGGGMPGVCGTQVCTPQTCTQLGIQCGPAGDGCGNLIQCGNCPAGQTCGGGGVAGVCGAPMCTPKTCAQLGANCGPLADGCGGILQCGACTPPQTCGGGGTANVCGGSGPG